MAHPASHKLKREDSILVIVDIQEKLAPAVSERQKVLSNVVRLVKFANIIGLPIIVSEQQKLGPTLQEIKSGLPHYDPVSKLAFDCFAVPEFREKVEKTGRHSLIVTGLETHICVSQTAISGLSQYNVHGVSDAMSSRSPHNWEVGVERMRQHGVVITSTEMVIYELLEKAGTDEFKAVLPLIK
jgi:nicotinamidase-related amidase